MQLPPDWQRRFDSSDDKHALQKTEYSAPGDTVRLYIGYYDETYEQDAQKHVDWYEEHRHEYGPAKSEDAEVGGHPAKRVTVERFATIYCVQLTDNITLDFAFYFPGQAAYLEDIKKAMDSLTFDSSGPVAGKKKALQRAGDDQIGYFNIPANWTLMLDSSDQTKEATGFRPYYIDHSQIGKVPTPNSAFVAEYDVFYEDVVSAMGSAQVGYFNEAQGFTREGELTDVKIDGKAAKRAILVSSDGATFVSYTAFENARGKTTVICIAGDNDRRDEFLSYVDSFKESNEQYK